MLAKQEKIHQKQIHALELPSLDTPRSVIEKDIPGYITESISYASPALMSSMTENAMRHYTGTIDAGIIPKVLEDVIPEDERRNIIEIASDKYPSIQSLAEGDDAFNQVMAAGSIFHLDYIMALSSVFRERRLAANLILGEYLGEIANSGTDLSEEPDIRVACSIGHAHESVFDEFFLVLQAFKDSGVELPFSKFAAYKVMLSNGQAYSDSVPDALPLSEHVPDKVFSEYRDVRLSVGRDTPIDASKYLEDTVEQA